MKQITLLVTTLTIPLSVFAYSLTTAAPSENPDHEGDTPAADQSCATYGIAAKAKPCMSYSLTLNGNPKDDLTLAKTYIKAWGDNCYYTDNAGFDCNFRDPKDVCQAFADLPSIYSDKVAPNKLISCERVSNDIKESNYSSYRAVRALPCDEAGCVPFTQTDVFDWAPAPRRSPLVQGESGAPVPITGPYSDIPDQTFYYGSMQTGIFDKFDTPQPAFAFSCSYYDNGTNEGLKQRAKLIEINKANNNGDIISDLAGYGPFPCDGFQNCYEPFIPLLGYPNQPLSADVHHVVPAKDARGCPWGTNSNKNAAIISHQLNLYFSNMVPPAKEVDMINEKPKHVP